MSNFTDKDSFLFAANTPFIEEMYARYLKNPNLVDESWRKFFESEGSIFQTQPLSAPSWLPKGNSIIFEEEKGRQHTSRAKKQEATSASYEVEGNLHKGVADLIDAFRKYGHLYVKLDPLGLHIPKYNAALDYKTYGITEADLTKKISAFGKSQISVNELTNLLKSTYSGRVGVEFMHLENPEERSWIQSKF